MKIVLAMVLYIKFTALAICEIPEQIQADIGLVKPGRRLGASGAAVLCQGEKLKQQLKDNLGKHLRQTTKKQTYETT